MGGKETKFYGDNTCPNQLQSQSSTGGLEGATGVEGQRDGRFRSCVVFVMHVEYLLLRVMCVDACTCTCGCKCKCDNVHSCMDTCTCMCSSAHGCGCVVDGGDTMAAF